MKITSDERRKIAAKLRAEVSEGECIDYAVCRIINDVLGVNGALGAKAARILADLIDPTCRIVSGDADNHMPHCNLCGTGNFDLLPKYCKGCGARIVYNENVN